MDATLLKGLRILEEIVALDDPVGISELARRVDLPKSNVHRTVASLREAGYLGFDVETRRYFASLKLAQMGSRVSGRFPFRVAAMPFLEQLVRQTGESAHFVLHDGASVVFLANALPNAAIASVIPDNLALHWEDSALGLALVSALPEPDQAALLAQLTDPAPVARQLSRAAETGHALIPRHETRRIFELAVPVMSEWQTVTGALGVTGPASRFSEERLPAQLAALRDLASRIFDRDIPALSEAGQSAKDPS